MTATRFSLNRARGSANAKRQARVCVTRYLEVRWVQTEVLGWFSERLPRAAPQLVERVPDADEQRRVRILVNGPWPPYSFVAVATREE